MQVNVVVNDNGIKLPIAETASAAGCDIRSNHDATINPGHRLLVKTGLCVEIPIGYEIQVRPRSGLALSKGITVINSPGTIDADYSPIHHLCNVFDRSNLSFNLSNLSF